jgi:Tfp pilus assembly protein PilZ
VQASETTLGLGAVVVKIVEGKAFFCWTSGDKGGGAALYRLELREGPPEPVRFHTFGLNERIEPGDVRWDMDHDTLFCLGEHPFPPLSPANPLCWVLRYPVKEMRPGPPGAPILPPPRREVDATGREVDVLDEHGFVPPDYGNVDILGLAGWHPGQEVPAFHCDIRVATSSSIRIYVASDARFRVWRYDGERCQAEGAYPLALVGPFRVASNGRTVIMQVSGTWVVLKDVREHATLAYKLRLLQSDQPPLVLDFSETGETCLVQTDRCLRIGEDDIDPIEFEKAPERVRMASQMIWRTLRESGPAAKRTGTTGEGAAEDAGRKRRDDADLERARELLAELLETRHAGGDIRAQVLDALRGGRDSRFSDDISALLLSRLDKLDGAEALIEAYTACGAYLERPSLEEGTRAALVDRAGLGRTAQELLGGDALLGVLARYMALAELQELADISEREGRADEVDRVRGFVRREAGRLLQDWPKLDLRAMVEEMAGAK